jgi:hypothetical protein
VPRSRCQASAKQVPSKCQASAKRSCRVGTEAANRPDEAMPSSRGDTRAACYRPVCCTYHTCLPWHTYWYSRLLGGLVLRLLIITSKLLCTWMKVVQQV